MNLDKAAYYIQTMEIGDYKNGDNGIYLSAYCGEDALRYDIDLKEYQNIKIGQCEGMIGYDGKQYMGVYPHNELYIYNRLTDREKPQCVGEMSSGQDRPFAMCSGDGFVFMGTIPDYGKRGGDVVIYNIITGESRIIKTPVKDQSIISLQYVNGMLFGSTSVWGGLGSVPDDHDAKIFIYDLKNDCMTGCFTPEIPGIEHPTWIGSIKLEKDGNLWGVTGNTLFYVDVTTGKVTKYLSFGEYRYSKVKHRWRPTYIRYDSNDFLYVNILGIHKVNKKNTDV